LSTPLEKDTYTGLRPVAF